MSRRRGDEVRRGRGPWLVVCGGLLVASQIGVALLSRAFVFGEGHAERPILLFLAIEAVAVVAYLGAVELVRGLEPRRWHLAFVLGVALLCRLVLFPSGLIQEVDPYRYLWDGQAVIHGANPYVLSPLEAYERGMPPAAALPEPGETVFERINYPHVPTIYPPGAQLLFAISQWATPWSLLGWRTLVLAAECGTVVLLLFALARLERSPSWILIYAWSPLALKELAGSLHVDAFVVLGLAGYVLAVLSDRLRWAFFSLAWTILLKFFSLALLPLVGVHALRRRPRELSLGVAIVFVVIGSAYAPWLDAGGQLFAGLQAFAERWQKNDSLFSLVAWVWGPDARVVCGALIGGVAAFAAAFVWRGPSRLRLLAASLVVIVAIFLLAPTANPWYFTWTLPLLVIFPSRALLLLSGLLLLYYADFYVQYQGVPEWFAGVRIVEYLPFYAMAVWELWQLRKRGRIEGGTAGMPD